MTVYFGSLGGTVYALDARTGRELWKFESAAGVASSMAAADGLVLFGTTRGLQALDARTGQARFEFVTNRTVSAPPAASEGLLYFGSWDGTLYAVRPSPR